jgi:hypothetical protein
MELRNVKGVGFSHSWRNQKCGLQNLAEHLIGGIQMKVKQALSIVFALGFSAAFAGVASAHHSIAGMDTSKEVVLKGTVAQYIWRNPHVLLLWDVKDASGKVTQWSGEMNSPTSMIQVGMNKNSLKPGDEVVVSVNPSRTGTPIAIIQKITMADGKLVVDRIMPQ